MKKYISKPIEIEAEQWWPPYSQKHIPIPQVHETIQHHCELAGHNCSDIVEWDTYHYYINTIECGEIEIPDGWFVVKSKNGYNIYSPEDFETKYELKSESKYICPKCGTENNGRCCDYVYGRRGWRQLGIYDG